MIVRPECYLLAHDPTMGDWGLYGPDSMIQPETVTWWGELDRSALGDRDTGCFSHHGWVGYWLTPEHAEALVFAVRHLSELDGKTRKRCWEALAARWAKMYGEEMQHEPS